MEQHARYDWGDRALLLHWAKWFLAGTSPREPLSSPLHADLRALPPLFVHVGSLEVQYDDAVRLTDKARAAGVQAHLEVWPEMIHNFHIIGEDFPDAVRCTAKLCTQIQGLLAVDRP